MLKSISVLGCGWLGFPLASRLVSEGFLVKGSTTSVEKVELLMKQGIKPYVLDVNPESMSDFKDFLDSDIVIITIPFRRQLENPFDYLKQMHMVIDQAGKVKHKPWFIFTSSTAVYPSDGNRWDESMCIKPTTAREEVLLATEQLILKEQGTVIRFGGLYGPHREIYRFFLKKVLLKTAQGRMNLIHLTDCINIIALIIQRHVRGEILNAVSDDHPTREELYTQLSVKYGVPRPVFDEADRHAKSKIVANDKIKRMLEYQFVVPSPMEK